MNDLGTSLISFRYTKSYVRKRKIKKMFQKHPNLFFLKITIALFVIAKMSSCTLANS